MGVHHVGITTKNLARSIAFYEQFGFRVESELTLLGEKLVFLKNGSSRIELILTGESLLKATNPHIAFCVEDVDDFLQEHEELLIQEGPYEMENGWKSVFILGPSDEQIELLQMNE